MRDWERAYHEEFRLRQAALGAIRSLAAARDEARRLADQWRAIWLYEHVYENNDNPDYPPERFPWEEESGE